MAGGSVFVGVEYRFLFKDYMMEFVLVIFFCCLFIGFIVIVYFYEVGGFG